MSDNRRYAKFKINPVEVFDLRRAGWTLQRLADHYHCTRSAVGRYLARTRRHRPRTTRRCDRCQQLFTPKQRGRFCSTRCYHASYRGSYVQWRHGQRLARRTVVTHFPLQRGHIVHHVDGDNRNNALSNLWVFASQADHLSYHRGGSGEPLWCGVATAA